MYDRQGICLCVSRAPDVAAAQSSGMLLLLLSRGSNSWCPTASVLLVCGLGRLTMATVIVLLPGC